MTAPTQVTINQADLAEASGLDTHTLRLITCGSVDDGKSTLIGRLLYECGALYQEELELLDKERTADGLPDFSVLLDEKVSWAEVQSALEKSVIDLTFVEEYRGKQIPEGKKSLTFTVTFGSDKGTLTSQEIEEKMGSINKKLQKLGGELRI